jgi:cytochrome c oxidase subunit II
MSKAATRKVAALVVHCFWTAVSFADPAHGPSSPTSIFSPASTPAQSIYGRSLFALAIPAAVFGLVFGLLAYAVIKFRERAHDDKREPPQVDGSSQAETVWTVIPVLIVLVLFLATGRVIANVQEAAKLHVALEVTVIGHQFWREYRYPGLNVVTANQLHVPVSDPAHPTPTFLTLLSADTDHSFWVPRLAGKTDPKPNHPNGMWIDPHEKEFISANAHNTAGVQHAKMLLRVYVQTYADFDRWIEQQRQAAIISDTVSRGSFVFETSPCLVCHSASGIAGNKQFGADLTRLMSTETPLPGPRSTRLKIFANGLKIPIPSNWEQRCPHSS